MCVDSRLIFHSHSSQAGWWTTEEARCMFITCDCRRSLAVVPRGQRGLMIQKSHTSMLPFVSREHVKHTKPGQKWRNLCFLFLSVFEICAHSSLFGYISRLLLERCHDDTQLAGGNVLGPCTAHYNVKSVSWSKILVDSWFLDFLSAHSLHFLSAMV